VGVMPKLITNSIYHRTVNGMVLIRLMDERGLTQRALAKLVDCKEVRCSQGYISQLARPGKWEVKAAFAERLREVLG
jgi:transcriptional regulator with XRE-family HTH domain